MRLGYDTVVFNRSGHAAMMVAIHNVIGITEDDPENEALSEGNA